MKKINKVSPTLVSDELYDKSIGELNRNPQMYNHYYKCKVIHLIDSVSRGYTTPLEAHQALNVKYFPDYLLVRESAYSHLV